MSKSANQNKKQQGQALKVIGCHFLPEMRTVSAFLQLSDINFTVDVVDLLTSSGQSTYSGYNPGMCCPTIIDGYTTVVGDQHALIRYLANSKQI